MWSCTARVRLMSGVFSKLIFLRYLYLSARLRWGAYRFIPRLAPVEGHTKPLRFAMFDIAKSLHH
jgi:hypothetical protein